MTSSTGPVYMGFVNDDLIERVSSNDSRGSSEGSTLDGRLLLGLPLLWVEVNELTLAGWRGGRIGTVGCGTGRFERA